LPPPGFDGWLTKTLFTFLGISSCTLTSCVPLGICGLDLIPTILWTCADTNGASVTIIIN
jgi:hypothetical protein